MEREGKWIAYNSDEYCPCYYRHSALTEIAAVVVGSNTNHLIDSNSRCTNATISINIADKHDGFIYFLRKLLF